MPGWMMLVEVAVRKWAGGRGLAGVDTAVRAALGDGVPTAEVIGYARRRMLHYRGAAVRA